MTDFATITNLSTLAGLSLVVYLMTTLLRSIFPTVPVKLCALIISISLSLAVAFVSDGTTDADIVLAIVNGFLAAGAATMESGIAQWAMVGYKGDYQIKNTFDSGKVWYQRWW